MSNRVELMASDADRVRRSSSDERNAQVDQDIRRRVTFYAERPQAELDARIRELAFEWDVERVLEANASTLAFGGVVLGGFVNRRWLAVPAVVTAFLFQHAVQGWCPPLPIIRAFGVRTRREIDAELFALKALRGDFDDVRAAGASSTANAAIDAVKEPG